MVSFIVSSAYEKLVQVIKCFLVFFLLNSRFLVLWNVEKLEQAGIDLPRHVFVSRDGYKRLVALPHCTIRLDIPI